MTLEHKFHGTAIITGASAGLGTEFARQLAARGSNLLLVARRLDRLEALAAELCAQYPVRVEVLSADLAEEAGLQAVEQAIARLDDLTLLVNNAGFGIRGGFMDAPLEKHLSMIQVHVVASVRLARAAVERMLPHGHGAVINVASMAAFLPVRNSTYSATKAYLVKFSEALENEVGPRGIHSQALCPGFTYTEFHDTPELEGFKRATIPGWLWLKAGAVVHDSLQALERGQVVCVPGWQYRIGYYLVREPVSAGLIQAFSKALLKKRR